MPRSTQIIPSYDVSHVMTVINDNSVVDTITDVVSTEPNVKFLCFFESAKGPDGVRTLNSTKDYIKIYGRPNFKKYGQPCYMPYLLLSTGDAKVHCIRVIPSDAQFANIVIYANITEDKSTHKVTVKYTAEKLTADLTDLSVFESAVLSSGTETKLPIIAFACTGRGVYGNDLSFRISSDTTSDLDNAYKNYNIEILSSENGLNIEEIFRGTISPNGIVGNKTLFIGDKINDPENGSSMVTLFVNEDALDTIYEKYVAAVTAKNQAIAAETSDGGEHTSLITPVPFDEFDFFLGIEKNKLTPYGEYVIDDSGINLEVTTGINLLNGSDGYKSASTEETKKAAIIEEYKRAMNINSQDSDTIKRYGHIATSKRRIPTDIILDAGYPDEVKGALYALAIQRTDAKLYLDAGFKSTAAEVLTWKTTVFDPMVRTVRNENPSYVGMYDFIPTCESAWYKTRDPFTGKIINVTYTWFLAQRLPVHCIEVGNHVPFVGEDYTLITDAIPGSVRPVIDADDLPTKDALYKAKINTVDALTESKYIRATQVTMQNKTSDLSEDNNALVLLEMKRMLENLVLKQIYNFSSAEDRAQFTEDATRLFDTYPNRKVTSFAVKFDMNEFERDRNILHCYLEVVFRQIATRGIIEIDINKRTS